MSHFQNQVFCITGATGGIGQAVALDLAKAGATCVLVSKNIAKLQQLSDTFEQLGYVTPVLCAADFQHAKEDVFVEIAMTIGEQFKRLDGLIHCAGVLGHITPVVHYPTDTLSALHQIYIQSPFSLTKACLPLLQCTPGARLVFTLNEMAIGKAYWGPQGMMQAALRALIETIAAENKARDLHVFGLAPTKVHTRLRAGAYPAEAPDTRLTPAQVATAYLAALESPPNALIQMIEEAPLQLRVAQ